MARWLVELEGDLFDLEELPYWFPNGDIYAIAEDDNVFLVGSAFEKHFDLSQVHNVALQAVDEFSAVIRLFCLGFKRPTVRSVVREDDKGKRNSYVLLSATFEDRAKMRASLSILGSSDNTQATQAQTLLIASRKNPHLRAAGLLWGDPLRTWSRLYRILEEVEAAVGKSVDAIGFCTKKERRLFTWCANSAEIAGKDARHRLGKYTPPSETMSLEAATLLIGRLLEQALRREA